jgi:hypothetical protein
MAVHRVALVLVIVASTCHARRVQTQIERLQNSASAGNHRTLQPATETVSQQGTPSTNQHSKITQTNASHQDSNSSGITTVSIGHPKDIATNRFEDLLANVTRTGGSRWVPRFAFAFLACIAAFFIVIKVGLQTKDSNDGNVAKPVRQQFTHKGRKIFEWEQDDASVKIYLSPPEGITKQNIDVNVQARQIEVGKRGKPPFIKHQLYNSVDEKASTWDFQGKGELQICLYKVKPVEWPCVLVVNQPKDSGSHTSQSSQSTKDSGSHTSQSSQSSA